MLKLYCVCWGLIWQTRGILHLNFNLARSVTHNLINRLELTESSSPSIINLVKINFRQKIYIDNFENFSSAKISCQYKKCACIFFLSEKRIFMLIKLEIVRVPAEQSV